MTPLEKIEDVLKEKYLPEFLTTWKFFLALCPLAFVICLFVWWLKSIPLKESIPTELLIGLDAIIAGSLFQYREKVFSLFDKRLPIVSSGRQLLMFYRMRLFFRLSMMANLEMLACTVFFATGNVAFLAFASALQAWIIWLMKPTLRDVMMFVRQRSNDGRDVDNDFR